MVRTMFRITFGVVLEDDAAHEVLVEEVNDKASHGQTVVVPFKESHDFVEELRLLKALWLLSLDASDRQCLPLIKSDIHLRMQITGCFLR